MMPKIVAATDSEIAEWKTAHSRVDPSHPDQCCPCGNCGEFYSPREDCEVLKLIARIEEKE